MERKEEDSEGGGRRRCLRTQRRTAKPWEWGEGKWQEKRGQIHRAGARVHLKHPRVRKPAGHQPQLVCFRFTRL